MQVNISGVHLEVTNALRDYIEEKAEESAEDEKKDGEEA
ncbi:HPF/RaiA family ribosome-associated protein [Methylobacterium organophilum]|nr:HPF/RaiA family ribosome-associated protein [Methylobacterium organophilum]